MPQPYQRVGPEPHPRQRGELGAGVAVFVLVAESFMTVEGCLGELVPARGDLRGGERDVHHAVAVQDAFVKSKL